nr:uncharacterized protein LOC106045597 [Anser cygnoides]XP_047904362.1 uncharacterized protein LOC106045597 [Anser cygnoides]XP_047904363.1 uncharacterized protein LOC106045597 [Anser cygnoides]XP_047904364.1 uncharacterized protein LOC106045597 [Anser cygnoides]
MDNPCTLPTHVAIQKLLQCKPMGQSTNKEWPPGILFSAAVRNIHLARHREAGSPTRTTSSLLTQGDNQARDAIQGTRAHDIPVGRRGTVPRLGPSGNKDSAKFQSFPDSISVVCSALRGEPSPAAWGLVADLKLPLLNIREIISTGLCCFTHLPRLEANEAHQHGAPARCRASLFIALFMETGEQNHQQVSTFVVFLLQERHWLASCKRCICWNAARSEKTPTMPEWILLGLAATSSQSKD